MLTVLRSPSRLQSCLRGESEQTADTTARRLDRRLRRVVMRSRGRKPRPGTKLWFDLDCNLYRPYERDRDRHFRGAWLAITGLEPRQRIHVPLAGSGIGSFASRTGKASSRPSIRVVINERVTFFMLNYLAAEPRTGDVRGGIDKGFNTLITLSTGLPETSLGFGPSAGALIGTVADRAAAAAKQRRRLAAYERSLRNSDPDRARRMRRRNLGTCRSTRRSRRDRAELRDHVGRSLNELFRTQPSLNQLYCEDLSFRSSPLSRSLNRRLGRWLKGYLHQRLIHKAELNGVELTVVNAAYTSQSCPRCWFTSSSNRHGGRFECADCGYTGSADAVAATNVLARGSDAAITCRTPRSDVRQILDERWRSARTGRAWGSNEAGPAMGVVRESAGRQSRERPGAGLAAIRATRRRSIEGVAPQAAQAPTSGFH